QRVGTSAAAQRDYAAGRAALHGDGVIAVRGKDGYLGDVVVSDLAGTRPDHGAAGHRVCRVAHAPLIVDDECVRAGPTVGGHRGCDVGQVLGGPANVDRVNAGSQVDDHGAAVESLLDVNRFVAVAGVDHDLFDPRRIELHAFAVERDAIAARAAAIDGDRVV